MGYGTSLGTSHEDEMSSVLEPLSSKELSDLKEIKANETSGDFQSRYGAIDIRPVMPPGASEKLTGALESYGSPKVPRNGSETKVGGMDPEGLLQQAPPRDASQDIYVNPWVTITPEDINTGINIGMGVGPMSMENVGKYKNYIDMFLKQPDAKELLDKAMVEYKKPVLNTAKGFEQQPILDTYDANIANWTKEQLHPDNFYTIEQNLLSPKQAKDLHDTWSDFKQGTITKTEYLDEMAEYEKFTKSKEPVNVPITESGMTHGQKVLDDLLSDYPELLNSSKATPKEKFLDALDRIHSTLSSTFANIRDKYVNTVKSDKLEPTPPTPPVQAAMKGYTEPAYRGLSVYGPNVTSPVYDFTKGQYLYSSDSPVLADMYAGYLNKHPGYEIPPGTFSQGAQVMPLYINTKDYHYYDAKGGHWTNENTKAIEEAWKLKKKGVIVDNVRDEPNSTTSLPPKKVFITFPHGAETVKSRFAKDFDPSSPNILHGIGSVSVAGGAAGLLTAEGDKD